MPTPRKPYEAINQYTQLYSEIKELEKKAEKLKEKIKEYYQATGESEFQTDYGVIKICEYTSTKTDWKQMAEDWLLPVEMYSEKNTCVRMTVTVA